MIKDDLSTIQVRQDGNKFLLFIRGVKHTRPFTSKNLAYKEGFNLLYAGLGIKIIDKWWMKLEKNQGQNQKT